MPPDRRAADSFNGMPRSDDRMVGARTLRVVLLSQINPSSTNIRNGVQAATSYLLRGLIKVEDLDLHLLTFGGASSEEDTSFASDRLVTHFMPPYPRYERLHDYRRYQRLLNERLAAIQPDLIHVQVAGSDALVALRSGYPTLVTAHGIRREEIRFYRSWRERLRSYFDSVVTEQQVMRRTRYLIAISAYMLHYFQPQLRADLRYFSIPNALDERFFTLGADSDAADAEKSAVPVILCAGRVTPLKRVMDLVQAFKQILARFPAAQLRIAGETGLDTAYVDDIRAWIKQAGIGESVHLLGRLDQAAIYREFDQCNLFVLPSGQENAPMAIAQAMAAAKPVVATNVGGVAEMIGANGERGLLVDIHPADNHPWGLAEAMLRILDDPALARQFGQAGRAFAMQNYHMDVVAQRTAEVYRLIAQAEAGRHG